MAKKYLVSVDLDKNELLNARLQNLGSDPSSPVAGQLYYDSGANLVKVYDGSSFKALTKAGTIANADIASGAAIALSKLATDPLARANHTGTQTASTISDFDTQVRTSRLDQMAAPTASVSLNSQKITNLTDPTTAQEAATKQYVDNVATGLDAKASVRAATTADISLAGAQTIDGVSVVATDRVLVKNQSSASENGIYVAAAGAWARASDTDTWSELISAFTFVEEGTTQADTGWVSQANAGGTLGSTSIAWAQFSSSSGVTAGDGLVQNGNAFDVVGTSNRISVSANAVDISSSYVGQTSITTLGTITTGVWNGTDVAVADGGTGASSAATARSNLSAAGYYSSATHSSGTTITVAQSTHGLRASRGLQVQVQEESSGDVVEPDISVASSGDVTVTFAASQSANSKRVTIVG